MARKIVIRRLRSNVEARLEGRKGLAPRGRRRRSRVIQYAPQVIVLMQEEGVRLHALLTRLTLREDVAEDLLQELAMKLAASDGFSQAHQPVAYAKRAAVNLAIGWRRQRVREAARHQTMLSMPTPSEATPVERLMRDEELDRLLDELAELNERDQWLLSRRYLNGCTYAELATEMDCTPHQARGLCHKAVRRLRERINTDTERLRNKEAGE